MMVALLIFRRAPVGYDPEGKDYLDANKASITSLAYNEMVRLDYEGRHFDVWFDEYGEMLLQEVSPSGVPIGEVVKDSDMNPYLEQPQGEALGEHLISKIRNGDR